MLFLLLLSVVLSYYLVLLWLSRRFRSRSWSKYWKVSVLVIGGLLPWIDQLLIRFVVVDGYCKREPIGLHVYRPDLLTASRRSVTWVDELPTPLSAVSVSTQGQPDYFKGNHEVVKVVACKSSDPDRDTRCLIPGYEVRSDKRFIHFLGMPFAFESEYRLFSGQTLIAQSIEYAWKGSASLRFFPGFDLPIFSSEKACNGYTAWSTFPFPYIVVKE